MKARYGLCHVFKNEITFSVFFRKLTYKWTCLKTEGDAAAAAAAKSLQSCPTLCDPINGSPPGSPVPGILQTRTLEWVAISFSSGSDHELLIPKFRLKLKKVGKTTRPFRYDLNKISYNYTVKVANRFKG